jgi:hypothetical protein
MEKQINKETLLTKLQAGEIWLEMLNGNAIFSRNDNIGKM